MLLARSIILLLPWSFSGALGSLGTMTTRSTSNFVLHERRTAAASSKWTKHSRAHPTEVFPIRVGLRQNNLHRAEESLLQVSDPKSPNFGKHWTAQKVANTFAPSIETLKEVVDWLIRSGIGAERHTLSPGQNWILFNATVDEAESLFNTNYYYYFNKQDKEDSTEGYRIACDEDHLPQHVRRHINLVIPTIHLEGMRPIPNNILARQIVRPPAHLLGLTGLANCYELITIECLRHLYQFGPGNTSAPGNEIGIPQWGDYLGPQSDLDLYFKNYTSPPIPASTTPEFFSIDGGQRWNKSLHVGGESALDVQTAYSTVYPQGVRLYQVGDIHTDSTGNFNTFLDALDGSYCDYLGGDAPYIDPVYPNPAPGGYRGRLQCGGAPQSNVLSFSYLQIEAALPESYQRRQCNGWMKLGLQGVSVIFATGDSGVANRYNVGFGNTCLRGAYVDINGPRFSPSFPCNCPWVTTVGGTFLKSRDINDGEIAVALPHPSDPKQDYYSGGGFSNIFERPVYQADAVSRYLSAYPPPFGAGSYTSSGRAFPDMAAIGLNVSVVIRGRVRVAGGTSASTPIIASIVTLLNEARIAAGKGPIGFLKPILYAHPEAFNDIAEGGNPGCGTEGFKARPGWDPVTGMGTPLYPKLEEIVLSLP